MLESHNSLSGDFDVSTPEIDQLVEIVKDFPGMFQAQLDADCGNTANCHSDYPFTVLLPRLGSCMDFRMAL